MGESRMTNHDVQLDEQFMDLALQLAQEAQSKGEVPVGALLVADNEVLATGSNSPIASVDPTAHAEMQVLREGAGALGNYRLPGTTLYVTLEPCVMCAGAIVHARVERVVYSCADLRAGAAGTIFNILNTQQLNHRVAVQPGIREAECRTLLQEFFRSRR